MKVKKVKNFNFQKYFPKYTDNKPVYLMNSFKRDIYLANPSKYSKYNIYFVNLFEDKRYCAKIKNIYDP